MEKVKNLRSDAIFHRIIYSSSICIVIILVAIFLTLFVYLLPSVKTFGLKFFTGTTWDPVAGDFGSLPFLVGTFLSAFLALLISTPFSLAISLSLGEYFKGSKATKLMT